MSIYVASSWRNPWQPGVVALLRELGQEVYDFRQPVPGEDGFRWSEIDPAWQQWDPETYRQALRSPVAEHGFKRDMDALRGCDACVLVLPCGSSSTLALGWAVGAGKRTAVLFPFGIALQKIGGHSCSTTPCDVCREPYCLLPGRLNSIEPELMAKCVDRVLIDANELRTWAARAAAQSRPGRVPRPRSRARAARTVPGGRVSRGLVVDLFAGGGGASVGIEAALGRSVDIAINHDAIALAVHKANHPETRHFDANLWKVDAVEATGGRPVDVLWASPDCTHHSVAKGGKPRQKNIRALAWVVVRWARDTRPRVIFLENVAEFRGWGPLDRDGLPIKKRKGETFRRWVRALERLGYVVEYHVLDASLYGSPTRRRRLFLVARSDGQSIRWPEPTHGPGRLPLRTAAECIDWSLACPSIFERARPLAEKTQWRIAQGIRRFVLENPKPFIVGYHSPKPGERARVEPLTDPLPTQTTENRFGLVTPALMKFRGDSEGASINLPMPTITAGGHQRPERPATGNPLGLLVPSLVEMNHENAPHGVDEPLGVVTTQGDRFNVVAPRLVKVNHGKREARGEAIDEPLTTVTAAQRGHAVVTPVLATIDQQGAGERAITSPEAPLPTTVTKNRHVVVAPTLIQTGYGERPGQAPRVLDLHKPLGTMVDGQKHGLVAAWLAKHYGGETGIPATEPTSTITATDHHGLAAVALAKFRGTDPRQPGSGSVEEPLPTISAGGIHVAEVRAFLTAYYGDDHTDGKGQGILEPLRTLTAKHRLGLVTVEGTEYQIVDIGMRMLQPHELARAQFGRFAPTFDLSAARTKSKQVQLIGNSVCPEPAEALVRANVPGEAERVVA